MAQGSESEKDKSEIRVALEGKFHEKLEALKEYFGILNNTEIIRFLITKTYREVLGEDKASDRPQTPT